jgi:hypothetical protein
MRYVQVCPFLFWWYYLLSLMLLWKNQGGYVALRFGFVVVVCVFLLLLICMYTDFFVVGMYTESKKHNVWVGAVRVG